MTPPPAALVYVVDDDPAVREALARLLRAAGFAVEPCASVREFLALPPYEGPCCLLLDVRMPGGTGLELQEALSASGRIVSIVFVTGHVDVRDSVRAMRGGAVDFLTKPVEGKELLASIRRAVDRTLEDRREHARVTEIRERIGTLTPREAEVFALVVTGMLNKQIAKALGVVEKTVKVHRARVMEKMRAGSVAELVQLAAVGGVLAARA
jgi:RNA polymerase sigma factor (sigma-70 family)